GMEILRQATQLPILTDGLAALRTIQVRSILASLLPRSSLTILKIEFPAKKLLVPMMVEHTTHTVGLQPYYAPIQQLTDRNHALKQRSTSQSGFLKI
ncbi:MAG TPA: hypothetical protein V6C50_00205, partial [Crinalium sp.]